MHFGTDMNALVLSLKGQTHIPTMLLRLLQADAYHTQLCGIELYFHVAKLHPGYLCTHYYMYCLLCTGAVNHFGRVAVESRITSRGPCIWHGRLVQQIKSSLRI